jgi:hypothetical protein
MTKNLRRIDPTEHQIQAAIVEWARNIKLFDNFKIGNFLLKNCNEGRRSWADGKRKKKEGLKKGVSDLFLAFPQKNYHGLWIEVKKRSGKMTKEQIEWFTFMNLVGYETKLVDEVDEGIQAIKDYLGMR